MSPAKAAAILSQMQDCIDSWPLCSLVDGANMSMSRWRRSHQNGAEIAFESAVEYDVAMACIIEDCRLKNEALLRPLRRWRQVVRKSGGSWSYVREMNPRPCSQWLAVCEFEKCWRMCVARSNGVVGCDVLSWPRVVGRVCGGAG